MDWKDWYRSQNRMEREEYAARAQTTTKYIEIKLIPRKAVPRRGLMESLARASLGRISYEDLVSYFLLAKTAGRRAA